MSIGERFDAAFDAADAAVRDLLESPIDTLSTRELCRLLDRCERLRRQLPVVEHPMINQLLNHGDPAVMEGNPAFGLAWPTPPTTPPA